MSKKRVLISGYYGFSNTGDDGVLSAIVSGLRASMNGDVSISVLSAIPEETSALYGVDAIPRMSHRAVRHAIRNCDLLISGGGSLIQDATSLQSAFYYTAIILQARMLRKRVMVLGQGIGPLRSRLSRMLTRRALSGIDAITVRDPESGDLLKQLGIKNPPVIVAADPTFLLQKVDDKRVDELLSETGIAAGEDYVALAFRDWPETPRIIDSMIDALGAIKAQVPARLLMLTMHTPEDVVVAERMAEKVDGIAVQPRRWSPEEVLGIIGRSKMVVSMRLHSLIFAAATGVPSVGVSYDPKVASFQSSIEQDCLTLDEAIRGDLPNRVLSAWVNRTALGCSLDRNLPKMKDAAEENIHQAVRLLQS